MLFLKTAGLAVSLLLTGTQAKALDIDQIQMPKSTFDGAHRNRWDDAWQRDKAMPAMELASTASWYGVPDGFHGQRTASGERFNAYGLSAAHRTLPMGTRVRVTNLGNGRAVIVRINDRGPYVSGRSIDLSQGAAARLGMISTGTATVRIQVLD
jgi:rare lipoprotein A (peptidoglycan hydrolase)